MLHWTSQTHSAVNHIYDIRTVPPNHPWQVHHGGGGDSLCTGVDPVSPGAVLSSSTMLFTLNLFHSRYKEQKASDTNTVGAACARAHILSIRSCKPTNMHVKSCITHLTCILKTVYFHQVIIKPETTQTYVHSRRSRLPLCILTACN